MMVYIRGVFTTALALRARGTSIIQLHGPFSGIVFETTMILRFSFFTLSSIEGAPGPA
jgi:hypothetical protein